jgi:hypothetical protein
MPIVEINAKTPVEDCFVSTVDTPYATNWAAATGSPEETIKVGQRYDSGLGGG